MFGTQQWTIANPLKKKSQHKPRQSCNANSDAIGPLKDSINKNQRVYRSVEGGQMGCWGIRKKNLKFLSLECVWRSFGNHSNALGGPRTRFTVVHWRGEGVGAAWRHAKPAHLVGKGSSSAVRLELDSLEAKRNDGQDRHPSPFDKSPPPELLPTRWWIAADGQRAQPPTSPTYGALQASVGHRDAAAATVTTAGPAVTPLPPPAPANPLTHWCQTHCTRLYRCSIQSQWWL